MNIRARLGPDETRARIIDTAEEHFRRVGYAKTTVADIATSLGMSPANVYRFFPSKGAINNAICQRLMDQLHVVCGQLVAASMPADEKLRTLILKVHQSNKSKLTDEHRLHDMIEVAMAENWPAIEAHIICMEEFFQAVLRQGIAEGRFREVDVEEFAETLFDACLAIFHPALIAQCADQDQDLKARRIADLILAALRP